MTFYLVTHIKVNLRTIYILSVSTNSFQIPVIFVTTDYCHVIFADWTIPSKCVYVSVYNKFVTKLSLLKDYKTLVLVMPETLCIYPVGWWYELE